MPAFEPWAEVAGARVTGQPGVAEVRAGYQAPSSLIQLNLHHL